MRYSVVNDLKNRSQPKKKCVWRNNDKCKCCVKRLSDVFTFSVVSEVPPTDDQTFDEILSDTGIVVLQTNIITNQALSHLFKGTS